MLTAIALLLGATAVYGRARGIPLARFTGDPVSILDGELYVGYLTTIGVLHTWGSAVVCAVSGYVCGRSGDRERASPLLYLATLVATIALDDAFLLHEEALPDYGVPQLMLPVLYIAAVAAFVWRYREFAYGAQNGLSPCSRCSCSEALSSSTWRRGGSSSRTR